MLKKIQKNLIFLILIICCVAVVSGCGKNPDVENNLPPAPSLKEGEADQIVPSVKEGETSQVVPSSEEGQGGVADTATSTPETAVSPVQSELTGTSTSTEEIDTSDWLVYRNKEYGFEIKYPKDWYFKDCIVNGENNYIRLALADNNSEYICGPDSRINISIIDNLNMEIEEYKNYNDYLYIEKENKNNIIIKQISGYVESLGPEGESRSCRPLIRKKETFIKYKDNYIDLYYSELFQITAECSVFQIQKDYSNIYDAVLNSFGFIK